MVRKIPVDLSIDVVVAITENHGGYMGGRCLSCNEEGWLEPRYGYPHRVKAKVMGTLLIHTARCPMNTVLNDDGSVKKRRTPVTTSSPVAGVTT